MPSDTLELRDAPIGDALTLHGARIALAETGSGEPVVALHCSASAGGQWRGLGGVLAGLGYRLVTPDLHGCGGSAPWPGKKPLQLGEEAGIVAEIARRLGRPVHVVGHSYGGAVALRAAIDHPGAVASIAVYEPSLFHLLRQGNDADRRLFTEVAGLSAAAVRAATSGDWYGGMAAFIDYWNAPGTFKTMPEDRRAAFAAQLPRVSMDFWALFSEQTPLVDYTCMLSMPVLIVEGDQSPAPSRRICRLLGAALPCMMLHTVPRAGHMGPVTHAETVNAVIASFLEDVSRGSRRQYATSA
ncbi:alpha/beta fold hydrolase [Caenispirillum bisanense]|uniref:Pimeloyl-ACP methyl ester carboxylesterase n=1 Tax=Caenispirillum bisanense TaxID=414052 RepID=A0A286GZM7_9PROT|nr:alpha/beta hydrolase [Caenispirillum bisanense]SOE00514.1 Pimeloyl-ACP methyl ester carboxylesterase [Caenispirillum bisanense]